MSRFTEYHNYVEVQASMVWGDIDDELLAELEDNSVDLYGWVDEAVHNHVDNDFVYIDLYDCAEILEQSDNIETDQGLWEGADPMKAIETQAFFTYRHDLMDEVIAQAKDDLETVLSQLEDEKRGCEVDMAALEVSIASDMTEVSGLAGTLMEDREKLEEEYLEIISRISYVDKTLEGS